MTVDKTKGTVTLPLDLYSKMCKVAETASKIDAQTMYQIDMREAALEVVRELSDVIVEVTPEQEDKAEPGNLIYIGARNLAQYVIGMVADTSYKIGLVDRAQGLLHKLDKIGAGYVGNAYLVREAEQEVKRYEKLCERARILARGVMSMVADTGSKRGLIDKATSLLDMLDDSCVGKTEEMGRVPKGMEGVAEGEGEEKKLRELLRGLNEQVSAMTTKVDDMMEESASALGGVVGGLMIKVDGMIAGAAKALSDNIAGVEVRLKKEATAIAESRMLEHITAKHSGKSLVYEGDTPSSTGLSTPLPGEGKFKVVVPSSCAMCRSALQQQTFVRTLEDHGTEYAIWRCSGCGRRYGLEIVKES
jgi:hypothetical protein